MKVAIVGASGVVGREMLKVIEERNIDCDIKLLASKRSVGQVLKFKGKDLKIEELKEDSFKGVDYVLGATGNDITKKWILDAKREGAIVIDNSSAFRLNDDTPLVIPEINRDDIFKNNGVISNPNCATIIALMAVYPIHKEYKIKRMIVTTFQAVSGAGKGGIEDLNREIKDENAKPETFPYQIAYNLIPQIGDFDDNGISKEEWKLQNESRKILHDPDILVNCTCVRVPILRSHSESITIECEKEVDLDKVRELISNFKGDVLYDNPKEKIYPMPLLTTDKDDIYVGRLRYDLTDPSKKSISLFCTGDQIRKGAATNAVEILNEFLK